MEEKELKRETAKNKKRLEEEMEIEERCIKRETKLQSKTLAAQVELERLQLKNAGVERIALHIEQKSSRKHRIKMVKKT